MKFWELVYRQLIQQKNYLAQLNDMLARGYTSETINEDISNMQHLVQESEHRLEDALEHRHDEDYGASTMRLVQWVDAEIENEVVHDAEEK